MYKRAIEGYSYQANWYENIRSYIFSTYSTPYLFAGLLAATSPQMSVKRSWKISCLLYDRILNGEKSINYHYYGLMPCHAGNIDRVIAGEELSGPKVRAFFSNLVGDYSAVTIDTWMLKFFHFDKCITPRRYERLANRIKKQAKQYNISPASMQAICWCWVRARNGRNPTSYVKQAIEKEGE
jgi:hypothetical protein